MPKQTPRERLADLEARQRAIADEANTVRRSLRQHYGNLVDDIAVESLTEREFRDVLVQAIRAGGTAAVAALKALPAGTP